MNDHDDNSLHKRIENLERSVNELQRRLSQVTDSPKNKLTDMQSGVNNTVPVQETSEQELVAAFTKHLPETEDDLKACPSCNKMIKKEAIKCVM